MALAAGVLAIAGAVVLLLSAIGFHAMREDEDRLHYLGPVGTLAPACLAIAIVLEHGIASQSGLKGLAVAAIVVVSGPFTQYVVLRALTTRRHGAPVAPGRPEAQR